MTTPSLNLDHRDLYRLPWSLSDNVISWLEPTKQCNIYCDGCYSSNANGSHKPLAQVAADLDVFEKYRKTDAVSVAGGDPLTHPEVVEIVRMIARRGLKPVVNTNGFAMTPALLRELEAAGLKGVTFHVDSLQRRPGWTGKSEVELNALRQQFADMVAEVGGVSCSFNSTVYEKTLSAVPEIVDWARRNPSKVQVVVFIAFRTTLEGSYDYYVGAEKVSTRELVYAGGRPERVDISAREIAKVIHERFPGYQPAAYLNGTEQADAFKWLMTLVVNDGDEIVGSVGPRFVELSQTANHLVKGNYLGYVGPEVMGRAKALLPLAALDGGLRAAARRWLGAALRRPAKLLKPLYLQSIMVIQPVDVLADGRASMCDGCPDMTVHQGELVWSCRLEEQLRFGQWMRPVPRKANGAA
ncbi:MAG TPA: radical SAM protein [Anaeromyxobacteraceae bacterium]|nr:radical SAM protein [Anaeromyxobacteraceae bacterium]